MPDEPATTLGVQAAVPVALLVAALLGHRVARALAIDRATAVLLVFGVGIILAATLVPQRLGPFRPTDPACLIPVLALPGQGRSSLLNDESLNVLLFVPLGLGLGRLSPDARFRRAVLAAIGLPWVIEATQLLVSDLGRWCQGIDLTANLIGLAAGAVAALVIGAARGVLAPTAPPGSS